MGRLAPVPFGVGHGAVHHQVIVLDHAPVILEAAVKIRAVLLIAIVGGRENSVGRIQTDATLETAPGAPAAVSLHLDLVDKVFPAAVQMGEAV